MTEHKWKLCLDRTLKLVNTVLDIHVYVLIYSVSNYTVTRGSLQTYLQLHNSTDTMTCEILKKKIAPRKGKLMVNLRQV